MKLLFLGSCAIIKHVLKFIFKTVFKSKISDTFIFIRKYIKLADFLI